MLEELHQMTGRIEKFSKAEHDLIKEVHPVVSDIKAKVEGIEEAMPGMKPRQES